MKENEKEAETEGDLHLEPPPLVMDVDGKDVSDEDHDSTFGSEFDIAAEPDSDDEPMNTTGTNIPHFPSLLSARPTQARGSTGTVIRHPFVPPSSTTTIPPTQAIPISSTHGKDVSDEYHDSKFGSEYDDMAEEVEENQVEENLIQTDSVGEPVNTTGTNSPHFPSVPSSPVIHPTPARGSIRAVIRRLLVPSSSTTTIPLAQTGFILSGPNRPHPSLSPIFPIPPTQTRSSTGSGTSRPFARPSVLPRYAAIAAPPQAKGSAPFSLSPAARGVGPWQMSLQPSLCVVCNKRPAYNDGRRAFPTCGNTCARELEAAKKSSNHLYTSGGSNNCLPSTTNQYQTRQTSIKMCEVCHVRPKYQKNNPTCGLTCAAKLQRPGSVEMSKFCGEKPKAVVNGQKFPHCETTCHDEAKIAVANATTCKACIICWQADSQDQSDFCSEQCAEVAGKKAPFLLELPRGHVAFKKVSDHYNSEWKNPRIPCPGIKKVYMVVMKPDFAPRYEDFKMKVSPGHLSFMRTGNEKRVWLEVKRDRGCGFGDTGNMVPCSSKRCILCSLVRSSISKEVAQYGIRSTPSLARAIGMFSQIRKKTSNVVVLGDVLFGREAEMSKGEVEDATEMPPHGYDSVNLVRYGNGYLLGETESQLVFDGDAVKPLYLITHE